jgi:starch-binding outer membrane protein, SusD/RagB family
MKIMKSYRIILIIVMGLFLFSSCEDQVLDKEPRGSFSENDIWADFELAKMYAWGAYKALGAWGIGSHSVSTSTLQDISGATDLAVGKHGSEAFETYMRGEINADDNPFSQLWTSHFDKLKDVNVFLANIDNVEGDEEEKSRLKGEMRFIRAYIYHELANIFGGVPLIKQPFTLEDDFNVGRDSYQDVVDFIVTELDEVINLVPETVPSEEWGRITKGAARALKSRTLLYAASKLHDPGTQPSGPLYDYTNADKWKNASDAAKAVLDMSQYSLVQVDDYKDYGDIFLHNNNEIILAKAHNPEFNHGASEYPDQLYRPSGYAAGWSTIQPTQNFVDDFQMEDGLSIEESPLYSHTVEGMYANRELRFYANIFYNGASFDPPLITPREGKVQYYLPGGLDGLDGPQSWNATQTGYNQRKYTDESYDGSLGKKSTTPFIYFRLAEFYLNYAEAQFHLGNEDVARQYVNMIRDRVHLPPITTSGQDLLDDIRHERKIELCFEHHRFYDARRWMIAEDVFGEDGIAIEWQYKNAQGELDINGELTFRYFVFSDRSWSDRMYWIPIPRSEIQKADNLEQNWNYD